MAMKEEREGLVRYGERGRTRWYEDMKWEEEWWRMENGSWVWNKCRQEGKALVGANWWPSRSFLLTGCQGSEFLKCISSKIHLTSRWSVSWILQKSRGAEQTNITVVSARFLLFNNCKWIFSSWASRTSFTWSAQRVKLHRKAITSQASLQLHCHVSHIVLVRGGHVPEAEKESGWSSVCVCELD